jgi:hypothetical protein
MKHTPFVCVCVCVYFFFLWLYSHLWTLAASHIGGFLNYFRHVVGLLERVISPSQGLYLHRTTQHRKMQTNIHALSRIRTHDPSNQPTKTHASDHTATVTGCVCVCVCVCVYIYIYIPLYHLPSFMLLSLATSSFRVKVKKKTILKETASASKMGVIVSNFTWCDT